MTYKSYKRIRALESTLGSLCCAALLCLSVLLFSVSAAQYRAERYAVPCETLTYAVQETAKAVRM